MKVSIVDALCLLSSAIPSVAAMPKGHNNLRRLPQTHVLSQCYRQPSDLGANAGDTIVLESDLDCSTSTVGGGDHGFTIDGIDGNLDGLTMDCHGYTIKGEPGSGAHGIEVLDVTGVSIRNCQVEHWSDGIRLMYCYGCEIDNCVATNNSDGILSARSVGGVIQQVEASENEYSGIYLQESENVLSSIVANANHQHNIAVYSSSGNGNSFHNVHACDAGQKDIYLDDINSAPTDTTNVVCSSVQDDAGTGWQCNTSCERWPEQALASMEEFTEGADVPQALKSTVKVIRDMIEMGNDEAACALLPSLLTHIDNAVKQEKLSQGDGDGLTYHTMTLLYANNC